MTESMRTALGRQVVSVASAEQIGSVKQFVVDETGKQVMRIHVAGGKLRPLLVGWESIASFGPDAVILDEQGRLSEPSDRDVEVVRQRVDVLGARVLDTDGVELGTVSDVAFDPDTGKVRSIEMTSENIDAGRIRALGTWALVVDAVR